MSPKDLREYTEVRTWIKITPSSPSWEAHSHSAIQKNSPTFIEPKGSLLLWLDNLTFVPIPSQMNPVHISFLKEKNYVDNSSGVNREGKKCKMWMYQHTGDCQCIWDW
jgi:hypothetical protein